MARQFKPPALVGWALIALSVCGVGEAAGPASERPLLVFAAASLADALGEVDREFSARSGQAVRESFDASSNLAKQIEAGAAADVFVSADLDWMDYVEARGLLRRGTRRDLLGNALVLIAPVGSTVRLQIGPGFPLATALGAGRLAVADPDSVPAGTYAHTALAALGVWDSVSDRLARAENVRTALAYVARGETPLGIVYRTDAAAEPRVRVVDVFPPHTHPPISYPVALTAGAQPGAVRYEQFLSGDEARRIFQRYGFVIFVPTPRGK
jgi:molybdate transport system substrate-binding protein